MQSRPPPRLTGTILLSVDISISLIRPFVSKAKGSWNKREEPFLNRAKKITARLNVDKPLNEIIAISGKAKNSADLEPVKDFKKLSSGCLKNRLAVKSILFRMKLCPKEAIERSIYRIVHPIFRFTI